MTYYKYFIFFYLEYYNIMEYKAETSNEITNKYLNDPKTIIQGGIFNTHDFNKAYEVMKENRKKIIQENDLTYLNQLTEKDNVKPVPIYDQPIYNIMINLKNTINDIFNELLIDIVHLRFNINVFFKDDRIFYIGIIFIVVAMLLNILTLLK
jgi:hypothetical protein